MTKYPPYFKTSQVNEATDKTYFKNFNDKII